MKSQTRWVKSVDIRSYPELKSDIEADVAIIGAGLTGILTAYTLAKSGHKVVIIEKETITEGATHLTTAFLTQIIDTDFRDLISLHGQDKTKRITDAHYSALEFIEDVARSENIECDFKRCSNYVYINNKDQMADLLKEYEIFHDLNIESMISASAVPGFKNFGYIEVRNQAKFHPLKFIAGLLPVLEKMGVRIYEKTEAEKIEEHPIWIKTRNGHLVHAKHVIAATYEPFGQPLGLFFKKGMYTSYLIEAEIPRGTIPEGIYEDTENPYHYFRIDPRNDRDLILLGGEDHRSNIPVPDRKNYDALEDYLVSILGGLKYRIVNRWDGPILEPSDGLALIGPYKNPHVHYAFGFSGNGMTYAGIAAMIFDDLLKGNENEMYNIYRTDRAMDPKSLLYKARDYGGELLHGGARNIFRRGHK